jgi:acyl-coenzyme A synthetase/AMP-(fatty) acid ligase
MTHSAPTKPRLPLLERQCEEAFAFISTPLASLGGQPQQLCVSDFIGQVMRLAALLPSARHVINLCDNRYLFTLGFCAALVRRQTNLLPQNRAPATQTLLTEHYPDSYILHDGLDQLIDDCAQFDLRQCDLRGSGCNEIPQIDADFLAAIAFTSGSTGHPKANLKPWHTFVVSTRMNAHAMLGENIPDTTIFTLATVPAQHMWGLETSLLLPLFSRLCISDLRPLFPLDVARALEQLPAPRLLISTPVHLRALTQSHVQMPQVERLLCATAPLSRELAQQVETTFAGELIEVYGCSEVGSMARRRTATTDIWQLFEGLNFNADLSLVIGAHLPQEQPLQDRIDSDNGRYFRLLGRSDDMLDIAGKRGSLTEMNKILLATPGIVDGVVFLPDAGRQAVTRPVALVVLADSATDSSTGAVTEKSTLDKVAISKRFSEHLDPVFIPRPLLFVDALPREANGKLPRAKLLSFYQQLRGK